MDPKETFGSACEASAAMNSGVDTWLKDSGGTVVRFSTNVFSAKGPDDD